MARLATAVVAVFLAFCMFAPFCFAERELQSNFVNWMRTHNKVYSNEEFHQRWQIWRNNFKFVEEFNKKGLSFTVGMNKFADLTVDEFNTHFKGLKKVSITVPENPEAMSTATLPASVDWRTRGVVTGIKNQGQCGSCWAFSTTGSLEGAHALNTGQLVSLSEQNLVDCSQAEGNNGCDGGLMDDGFQYVINNKGIDTEASYPYTAEDGTCQYNPANCGSLLVAFQDVQSGSESALQTASATIGPVSVAIDASHSSFQMYSSGVYYEPDCSATQLDHGVLVVGYGTSAGSDYWIVKNSWGTDWGMNGYIWMSRNRNNNCGIATMASYPLSAGATNC
jgi:cathepsin L